MPLQKPLPTDEVEWEKQAKAEGVHNQDINDREKFNSASTFKHDQYLSLRVLQQEIRRPEFRPERFGLDGWIEQAREELNQNNPSWKIYLDNFSQPTLINHNAFSVATKMQRQVAQVIRSDNTVSVSIAITPSPISNRLRSRNKGKEIVQETPSKPMRKARSNKEDTKKTAPKTPTKPSRSVGDLNKRLRNLKLSIDKDKEERKMRIQKEEDDQEDDEEEDDEEEDDEEEDDEEEDDEEEDDEEEEDEQEEDKDDGDAEYKDDQLSTHSESSTKRANRRRLLLPPTEDEQIVNLALLDFLQPLTMFADLSNEWTIHRRILTAKFKTSDFEARTDGYLRDLGSKEIRAIIEVKAASRARKAKPIVRQESAAMVNWIMNSPTMTGLPGRCVQVAQDRHEIYLIFGEFNEQYVRYLHGGYDPKQPRSFLTRYQIGPFDIGVKEDMEEVGILLLAITMRADADWAAGDEKRGVL